MARGALVAQLSIALLVAATAVGASPDLVPKTPLVITAEERWEDQNRTVDRNIVVADGGRLIVENSTLDLRIEQICSPIQGTLGYCQPEVNVQEGGELVVRNSTLTSSFEEPGEWPYVQADGGNLTIHNSTLSRLGPVRAQFDGHLDFRGNHVVSQVGRVGIWRGSDGTVADSRFEADSGGVTARDASPQIRNNTFVNIHTWSVGVRQSVVGDKAYTTEPLIVDNVFLGPDQGIFTDSGAGFVIAHNRFEDARFHGVNVRIPTMDDEYRMLDQQPPRIEANVFVDGYRAVNVATVARDATQKTSRIQVTGNVILGSECDHVEADGAPNAPLEVDARYNWWGTDQGPPSPERASEPHCEGFDGSASFDTAPWLSERPAGVGPRTS